MRIFFIIFSTVTILTNLFPVQNDIISKKIRIGPGFSYLFESTNPPSNYESTKNHLHIGFRWQPYTDRPKSSEADINREIGKVASYASFWYMSLHALPEEKNLDYHKYPSKEALAIRHAIKLCKMRGIKTELVLWQVPLWMNGGKSYPDFNKIPPNDQAIYNMVKATVEWFGEDVDYYSIFHEANHPKYWEGTWDELINLFMLPATRAIRDYTNETGDMKIVSTAGLSPSRNCKKWYDIQLDYPELMDLIDNFAVNLSDFNNGWGGGLLTWVSSVWDQLDYMKQRLNEEGYDDKGLVAAESWICWDGERTPHGPEGSGDTVESTLRILGECIQRGLSLTNLPWSDNHSAWSMGLTKRLDYNGQLAILGEKLNHNFTGGPNIATRKLNITGSDKKLIIQNNSPSFNGNEFGASYAVPDDPNHTHYYIWRWFAQLSAGQNECIHHTIADEEGNDIIFKENHSDEFMRMSSYDRTKKRFIILLAKRDPDQESQDITISFPATIQNGNRYNRDNKFTGEGFTIGDKIQVRWTTEDVETKTGYRKNSRYEEAMLIVDEEGQLTCSIPLVQRLTTLVFEKK